MFLKRKEVLPRRRYATAGASSAGAPEAPLSPRFARLVRESWWFVVVALFIWLALILATYDKSDRSWSHSADGDTIANRGGVAGAWLSDLLLYLFGFSAWWWTVAGIVLVFASYRRI